MSLHYPVKYECPKRYPTEICIVINDKSQGSIAKRLRCNEFATHLSLNLLVKKFIISEHLAKLQAKIAKWLIVSCAPFDLHFCFQRCWSRQISWITYVLRTETVTNCCCVNRQMNVSYCQQISNCCRPVLTYWPIDWRHQWLTDWWSCTAFFATAFLRLGRLWRHCTM